ncbi:hypothetical protein CSV61_15820 [Sporosarcina sp. P3]|uniref:hypothetical protein n=1 Tax=Sporosarcina sp. P3 TaxID=2048245 RepID=UPI000C169920|nr:hypothetical protein [Sporosarcina sp. P3]PID20224.1 hypothetical protein CSV61_15820 [Sporosarcina sp. P3]
MAKDDRIEIIKKNEMRTKEISKMIGEGGIGADKYYDIRKKPAPEDVTESREDQGSGENK